MATPRITPQEAWDALVRGNERFMAGTLLHPQQSATRRSELSASQAPDAAFLGCSDSRVAAEILFDCGLGDLFVARNIGQIANDNITATMEFAVAELAGVAAPLRCRRAMQHGLAVKTDHPDVGHLHAAALDEAAHGIGLRAGQRRFRFRENRRLRPLEVPGARGGQRRLQQRPQVLAIGHQFVGPELLHGDAIGPQERHIDKAVEGGAGHQADGPDRLHGHLSAG